MTALPTAHAILAQRAEDILNAFDELEVEPLEHFSRRLLPNAHAAYDELLEDDSLTTTEKIALAEEIDVLSEWTLDLLRSISEGRLDHIRAAHVAAEAILSEGGTSAEMATLALHQVAL